MLSKEEIMNNMCCPKNKPIRTKEQFLKTNHKIKCNKMSKEWKENIKDNLWATNYSGKDKMDTKLKKLRDLLLSFGGEEVCLTLVEEDLLDILNYGQIFLGGSKIRLIKGEPCHCHSNSCNLYEQNHKNYDERLRIATGYALSKDGMWRQHSWLVLKRNRSYEIIETTNKRELYFGFCMTDEQADMFCNDNY